MLTSPPSSLIIGRRQRGVTLTELMIALVLGALVVLAATAMVVSSRSTYRSQDENTRIAEASRFGLELSNRMVRLAGFVNWGNDNNLPATYQPDPAWASNSYAMNGPNIVGANNSKPNGTTGLNGSDSLTVRYFGSSPPQGVPPWPAADGNVLDCAGTPVPDSPSTSGVSATTLASAIGNAARAYNVLYVDNDVDGEPALFCLRQKYDPVTGQPLATLDTPQVLIRGVEDFQILFGEYIPPLDGSGVPLSLDDVAPQSIVYKTGVGGPNAVGNWSNVRSVRIGMLLRSATGARTEPEATTVSYNLFGAAYASAAGSDTGATFNLSSLSAAERTRVRRVVETTVFVRNRENQWSSVQFN